MFSAAVTEHDQNQLTVNTRTSDPQQYGSEGEAVCSGSAVVEKEEQQEVQRQQTADFTSLLWGLHHFH